MEPFLEKTHFHDYYSVILILKGQVQVCVNEVSYTADRVSHDAGYKDEAYSWVEKSRKDD